MILNLVLLMHLVFLSLSSVIKIDFLFILFTACSFYGTVLESVILLLTHRIPMFTFHSRLPLYSTRQLYKTVNIFGGFTLKIQTMNSILITGCSRGLGLGIVKELLDSNQPVKHIFATCRDPEKAKVTLGFVQLSFVFSVYQNIIWRVIIFRLSVSMDNPMFRYSYSNEKKVIYYRKSLTITNTHLNNSNVILSKCQTIWQCWIFISYSRQD